MADSPPGGRSLRVLYVLLGAALMAFSCVPGCSRSRPEKPVARRQAEPKPKPVYCPLCGVEVKDPAVIKRRPVAVKIQNDLKARPQSGLENACIVYEETGEGGVTGFMAIYLCRDADPVGPVGIARPVDLELVYPYFAAFAHSGGSRAVLNALKTSGIPDIDEKTWTGAFWKTHDRYSPYNIYSNTNRLRQAADASYPFQGDVTSPFKFRSSGELLKMATARSDEQRRATEATKGQSGVNAPYQPRVAVVNDINIPYAKACAVHYAYDPATENFLRFVAGPPQTDMPSGRQVAAGTVIVQYVTEGVPGTRSSRGSESPDLGVIGSGRAQVFMMGQMVDANWEKSARTEYTRYLDSAGKQMAVKPGTIWIELVPANGQVAVD